MNHALATSRLPPPSLTVRGDGQFPYEVNATWNAITFARHESVDDVHRRIDNALSLRGMKEKEEQSVEEETWSAIKNSASGAKLTEDVIRPMFIPPPGTADERQQNEGESVALMAKRLKYQRRRRRKPQSRRFMYSPFYPFKIFQSSARNANQRNRKKEDDSRKRRRQNVIDGGGDSKRPRPSRPKHEDDWGEKLGTVNQPYEFWRPQENFFSVQIPPVRQDTNTNRRRDEKRRQRDQNKSENPRELEHFWSEHLTDLRKKRSKKGRRRKHGAPYRTHKIVQEHVIPHHGVGDGRGPTNIVIRVWSLVMSESQNQITLFEIL